MRARILGGAAIILWMTRTTPALADDAVKAAAEFAEGQKAFTAKDYVRAAGEFEAAYRDKPHHAPLWNAARSWQRAGEDVRAANLYAKYLREAPADAPDRDQAIAGLKELAARLVRIETHADVDVTNVKVDGKPLDDPTIYVAPGDHTVEGESKFDSKGAPKPTRVAKPAKAGAGERISVTLSKPIVIVETPKPIVVEDRKPLPPALSFVGAGLALIGGGFTIASGSATVHAKHVFQSDDTNASKLDDAQSSQTRTNVFLGVSIGVAVLTSVVAVFFTDWKSL